MLSGENREKALKRSVDFSAMLTKTAKMDGI